MAMIAGNPMEPIPNEFEQKQEVTNSGSRPLIESSSVGILDLFIILLRRKKFLAVWMTVISALAVITTIVMEKSYSATAVLLPPKSSSSSPLGSLMGDLPIGGILRSMDMFGKEDNNKFMSILESRTLALAVIERFNLVKHYELKKKPFFEVVIKVFNQHYKLEEDKKDNILVTIKDKDPALAAEMANFIVDKLDSISFELSKQSARGSRLFFEERLRLMTSTLDSVHHKLADFQVKNNFIDLDQQVKASIEALASIEAEAMATNIESDVLSSKFGGDNSRIAELKKKEKVLKNRIEGYMQKGSGSLIVPLSKTPEMAISYAYLLRDVKVQETLYAYILQMYEQAKFREANNSSVVSVLERAVAPEKRSSPKRGAICILVFFLGFGILSITVLLQHWFNQQKLAGTTAYFKLQEAFGHFRLKG